MHYDVKKHWSQRSILTALATIRLYPLVSSTTEAALIIVQNATDPKITPDKGSVGEGDTCLTLEDEQLVDNTYKFDFMEEYGTYDYFKSGLTIQYKNSHEELPPSINIYSAEEHAIIMEWQ